MRGGSLAFGAVSLVNAIAGGRGATVSVGLTTEATVDLSEGKGPWRMSVNGEEGDFPLLLESARRALQSAGVSPSGLHGSIETVTSIPVGVGLKGSSSSSVAVAMAVMDALGRRRGPGTVLRCSVEASLGARASITGALDDAASCMLGGVNLANNAGRRLLSSKRLRPSLEVLVRVPKGKSRRRALDVKLARRFAGAADSTFVLCERGDYWAAMTLNGLLYSRLLGYEPDHAVRAVELGALGAGLSGTGPSVAAVFEPSKLDSIRSVEREWSAGGATVLRTRTNNRRARFAG